MEETVETIQESSILMTLVKVALGVLALIILLHIAKTLYLKYKENNIKLLLSNLCFI